MTSLYKSICEKREQQRSSVKIAESFNGRVNGFEDELPSRTFGTTWPRVKNTSNLTIPCHWDKTAIDKIVEMNSRYFNGLQVKEVYGVLAGGGPVGHGRSRKAVVAVTPEDAIDFRQYIAASGLQFTYLLNAPFKFSSDNNVKDELNEYLDWIFSAFRPDSLMISSYELMRYIRDLGVDLPIYISTIAGVKSVDDLEGYLDIRPSRVVVHHDLGREWQQLSELLSFCEKFGIEGEMLATESCLYRCPNRAAHYEHLAGRDNDGPFHITCNTRKLTRPREFLMAGGMVRPEDISLVENIGVRNIKISGRSKPASWLPEVVDAYLKREYGGNLLRLLGVDPSLGAEDWIYLSNKALDGFLVSFPFNGGYDEKAAYCDDWIVDLYQSGNFKLLDGSTYAIKGGSLLMDVIGEKAGDVIKKEIG